MKEAATTLKSPVTLIKPTPESSKTPFIKDSHVIDMEHLCTQSPLLNSKQDQHKKSIDKNNDSKNRRSNQKTVRQMRPYILEHPSNNYRHQSIPLHSTQYHNQQQSIPLYNTHYMNNQQSIPPYQNNTNNNTSYRQVNNRISKEHIENLPWSEVVRTGKNKLAINPWLVGTSQYEQFSLPLQNRFSLFSN